MKKLTYEQVVAKMEKVIAKHVRELLQDDNFASEVVRAIQEDKQLKDPDLHDEFMEAWSNVEERVERALKGNK